MLDSEEEESKKRGSHDLTHETVGQSILMNWFIRASRETWSSPTEIPMNMGGWRSVLGDVETGGRTGCERSNV